MLHKAVNKNTRLTDSYYGCETVPVCVLYKIDFYREIIAYMSHQNMAYY